VNIVHRAAKSNGLPYKILANMWMQCRWGGRQSQEVGGFCCPVPPEPRLLSLN